MPTVAAVVTLALALALPCLAAPPPSQQKGGASCTTNSDCSLGGECVKGACVCEPTFTSANCSELHLLPAQGTGKAFYRPNASSWGGSVVVGDDGEYHMYVNDLANGCGLDVWTCGSFVTHASSKTPEGPYTADVPPHAGNSSVADEFSSNPTVQRLPDGSYIIARIGTGVWHDGVAPTVCHSGNGTTDVPVCVKSEEVAVPPVAGATFSGPNLIRSTSGPNGPFVAFNNSGWGANNPGLYVNKSTGALLLVSKFGCNSTINPHPKTFCRQFGVASAPSWRGPWTFHKTIEVFGEDSYIWRSKNGFHMLFQGGGYVPALPKYTGHFHHAWSENGLDWTVNTWSEAFSNTIALASGGSLQLQRRERHQLLFATGDETLPTHLFNGASYPNGGDHTFTSVQPLNTQ